MDDWEYVRLAFFSAVGPNAQVDFTRIAVGDVRLSQCQDGVRIYHSLRRNRKWREVLDWSRLERGGELLWVKSRRHL